MVNWYSLIRYYPGIPASSFIRDIIFMITALLIVLHSIKYHHQQSLKAVQNYDTVFRNSLIPFVF
ncbi:hypothetical protein N180_09095 [Pedobacter antarcticus 4BY]|uniref:Uncharacterized protein n=1 Tax=Pedobacter antarcticus 4BY TaxID=1358423 RepID=A0A081PIC4_9SPHI|nr:hypothetical protein N180_09095 [Pedobacter antarcticus 4BY]